MIHLLEAQLSDQIYSTTTTALAESLEAVCHEARAGKSRGVGTFHADIDSKDSPQEITA